jgi:hypothetical protein
VDRDLPVVVDVEHVKKKFHDALHARVGRVATACVFERPQMGKRPRKALERDPDVDVVWVRRFAAAFLVHVCDYSLPERVCGEVGDGGNEVVPGRKITLVALVQVVEADLEAEELILGETGIEHEDVEVEVEERRVPSRATAAAHGQSTASKN